MAEQIQPEEQKGYNLIDHTFEQLFLYIGANILKYGGLLCGIAGVVGEEPSTSKILAGGLGFLVGTLLDKAITRCQSLRDLEYKLEGEQNKNARRKEMIPQMNRGRE